MKVHGAWCKVMRWRAGIDAGHLSLDGEAVAMAHRAGSGMSRSTNSSVPPARATSFYPKASCTAPRHHEEPEGSAPHHRHRLTNAFCRVNRVMELGWVLGPRPLAASRAPLVPTAVQTDHPCQSGNMVGSPCHSP